MAKKALDDLLKEIVGAPFPDGEDHCYFKPPSNIHMYYPCIVYKYVNDFDEFADNIRYRSFKRYSVTVIDEDPDSKIQERLKKIPYCSLDHEFAIDGLNHFVHVLYYNGPRIKEEL